MGDKKCLSRVGRNVNGFLERGMIFAIVAGKIAPNLENTYNFTTFTPKDLGGFMTKKIYSQFVNRVMKELSVYTTRDLRAYKEQQRPKTFERGCVNIKEGFKNSGASSPNQI